MLGNFACRNAAPKLLSARLVVLMTGLTVSQRNLYDLLSARSRVGEPPPTLQDICRHFGFKSKRAASDHLSALERKGFITRDGSARGIRILQAPEAGVPLLGSIAAGWPEDRNDAEPDRLMIEPAAFGIRESGKAFALRVRGDSMTGRQLFDGDIVLCDAAVTPRHEQIVAALINNETTLKTLIVQRGKSWLRAENPRYPDLIPATGLVVQGVVRGVIRFLAS